MKSVMQAHWLLAALLISSAGVASAQLGPEVCGDPFRNHYGPFDYRITTGEQRDIVERVHFTPVVESLRAGNTSMGPGGDLEYTLNVFPNHHRALMSLMKFALREKSNHPGKVRISVECRFDRAERFRPEDAMVKVILGLYLLQSGKPQPAVAKLEEAATLDSGNVNVYYNLGLAYVELKQYDKALKNAHLAYGAGFPLPGLRDKLQRAGKWQEPAAVRQEEGGSAAADAPPVAPPADKAAPAGDASTKPGV